MDGRERTAPEVAGCSEESGMKGKYDMPDKYEPKKAMGWVFGAATVLVAMPSVLIASGIVAAFSGDSYSDTLGELLDVALGIGGKFGDNHGGKLLAWTARGAMMTIGADGAEAAIGLFTGKD